MAICRGIHMTHWGQKPKSKPARPVADILRERNEKRTAALIACIAAMKGAEGADTITHSLVAERAGIPVQYVEWKYPSRENLLAMAAR
jgi:DNA-binding transcriptional regulator YbjK